MMPEPNLDPDPRVKENGSVKLRPKPLISFFSSRFPSFPGAAPPSWSSRVSETTGSSSPLTSHTNGLDVFVFTAPLRRLLGGGTGVRTPPIPLPTCNPKIRGDGLSFLAEETNNGKGICVGKGIQCLPGGAIQSGFGGEGALGVEDLRRGAGCDVSMSLGGCGGEGGCGVSA